MMVPKFLWIFVLITNFVSKISCEGGISLAFAIDDTRSMWDDIDQVKKEAKAIMQMVINTKSSEVKDFVLVTINDPDVILRTKTTSHSDFLAALNRIRVHNYGNYDCEERALAGIEKALKFSKPESYIYVFTDASTKELEKLNNITRLCQKKQSQVVFVLTGDCGEPSSRRFTVYYDIAKACSGQVFTVKKNEVHSVLKTVELLLKGKNSIFKWKTIPKTTSYIPVPFTLDEKAEYAIVSTSGKNVKLRITTTESYFGTEPDSEKTMWNDNGKVVKLVKPKPGTYYAWVKGDSTISVVVYGRTDFTFGHGFSVLEPKSMKDTAKQPIAGLKQHLSINVTDPEHSVDIKSAQILDIKNNDNVINELSLRNIGDNVYITEAFVLPNETFKISVRGEVKKTHESITRNSRNIDPQIIDPIPESIPDVKIDEEKVDVNYGSAVSLTCRVTAHPAPKIEWYSSSGVLLPSNSAVLEDPVFVSYLKLSNIKQDQSYVCKASNRKGSGNDSKIKVSVRPVFINVSVSEESVKNVKYGEDVKILCNIKSYLPITIRWFRSGKQLGGNSGKHSISPDGSELTLKSMNIEMQGKYTCETTLNSDPAIKQVRDIEVKIPGLARPEIHSTSHNKTVMKGDTFELNCKIAVGYPKPYVKWFKKIANINEFTIYEAFVNSEVLTFDKASFPHAGQYKCEAINAMGTDTATFEVTVNSVPVITIAGAGAMTEVAYDSDVEYTCKVESYPAPNIVWKDEKGSVLQNKVTQIGKNEYSSQLKLKNVTRSAIYTCLASNSIGSRNDQVKCKVRSPFVVKSHINETIEINYGSKHDLVCDVKSAKPMGMRWLKQGIGANSSKSVFTAFDGYTSSGDGTRLTILSMDSSKAGKYTCEYVLLSDRTEKVAFSATVKVVGLIAPKVTNSTVLNGKNFTAICRIKGVPKPIISWQFKQNGSEEFTPIPGSGEELNIPELRLKHTGIYKCIAKNELGSTQHDFDLVVKEPPTITNEDPNHYAVEGDLVMKIPCDVTGYPEPTIIWKKGGNVLNTDSKYVIKGTTLHINKPVHSDSEEYTCEANNTIGSTTKKFIVEVVASFDSDENFIGVTKDIYAEQGKPKAIKCNLKNSEEKSVRWYMDGVLTNKTGSTYTIERASISDEGNYTCRVNTDEGSRSETYVLNVGYSPFFEDNSPSPITIDWQDGYQMLDCAADSQPSPQFKWLHNGKIEPGKKSQQIPITDWGNYTCQVTNVHGNISKTFEVGSSGCYLTMNVLTQNQPLVSELDIPSWPSSMGNSDILLMENEEIKLSCPNNTKSTNAFKIIPNKQEVIAKCNAEDKFTVDGKIYRYSELICDTKIEPLVLGTRRQCSGPNTELIRIGFEVNGFLDAYRVCFDRSLNVPLYAKLWTLAPRTGDGVDSTKFNWSSTPEVGKRNLGLKTEGWKPKENCKCCYTKGQLMNVNELAFGPAQAATFKENLNSVPIWNPSCDDNSRTSWQAFDDEIRAMSLANIWSTWTGASEWTPTKVGLAPRFLWKALNYEEGSTVMVYVNDKSPVDSDIRCSEPCESMMEADPFLYCCTLDEFSKKFGVPIETFQPE